MKIYLFILIFLGTNLGSIVSGDFYDITTIYTFKTHEEADDKGNPITKYLDICTVTVHPQTNAMGLPYYNIESSDIKMVFGSNKDVNMNTKENDMDNVKTKSGSTTDSINNTQFTLQRIFPLSEPPIPSLIDPFEDTEWETIGFNGTLHYGSMIASLELPNLFTHVDMFSHIKHNSIQLGVAEDMNTKVVVKSGYQYGCNLPNSYVEPNVFLSVHVAKNDGEDFRFNLIKNNENFINVSVSMEKLLMVICPSRLDDGCENFPFKSNETSALNVFISYKDVLILYDTIGTTIFTSEKIRFNNNDIIVRMEQSTAFPTKVDFTIVQLSQNVVTENSIIVSPWFYTSEKRSSLFITYFRKTGGRVTTHIKERYTENSLLLESEDKSVVTIPYSDHNIVDELVLTKVTVSFPEDWYEEKQIQIKADEGAFIRYVWEGGDLKQYRINGYELNCVKSEIDDIYNIALRAPKKNTPVSACLNGGLLDEASECVCPPGFTGDSCEIACGRNYYGQKCWTACSDTGLDCLGMILCTPSYGCSCAPGFKGDKCIQPCLKGTYGADCKQSCGQCKEGCDIYTGHCRGQCDTPYLIWPMCKEPHTYWNKGPRVVESSFTSVKLSLNFSSNNIAKYSDETRFYMIQYKEDEEKAWTDRPFEIFEQSVIEHIVDKLKPGRKYLFRVLLIDKSLQTSDPELSKVSAGLTKCTVSTEINSIREFQVKYHQISLVWTEQENKTDTECPFQSYILDIEAVKDDYTEKRKILNIRQKSMVVKSLASGQKYLIQLKKMTVRGESGVVASVEVSTNDTVDKTMSVLGVTMKTIESDVHIQWLESPIYKTYFIKYKLMKRLSCSLDAVNSTLQEASTTSTSFILHLEPNALYEIFLTGDQNQDIRLQNSTVITFGKIPDISPSLLKEKTNVLNESVQIFWSDPASCCERLNGFFKNYLIELLDTGDNVLHKYNTGQEDLSINELSPNTSYKVRIRYVNHIGFNPFVFEEEVFTTTSTSPKITPVIP